MAGFQPWSCESNFANTTGEGEARPVFHAHELRARALVARRERLIAMRNEGLIGDAAFHRLEEELDFSDLAAAPRT